MLTLPTRSELGAPLLASSVLKVSTHHRQATKEISSPLQPAAAAAFAIVATKRRNTARINRDDKEEANQAAKRNWQLF